MKGKKKGEKKALATLFFITLQLFLLSRETFHVSVASYLNPRKKRQGWHTLLLH